VFCLKQRNLTVREAAAYVSKELLASGVVIQFYEAFSTTSLYMKFDCGLANSLRIGDHRGKKHLNYMFMVDVNHRGKRRVLKNKFTQYIYGSSKKELNKLIKHILSHRESKVFSYFGEDLYREEMKNQYKKNKCQKGFWSQSTFIKQGLYS
jgi:hypothetical protein